MSDEIVRQLQHGRDYMRERYGNGDVPWSYDEGVDLDDELNIARNAVALRNPLTETGTVSSDEIVATLAEVLPFEVWQAFHGPRESPTRNEREEMARALLPTVRYLIAEELRSAANELQAHGWSSVVISLRTRANALDPS